MRASKASVEKVLKKIKRWTGTSQGYQDYRSFSLDERWSMINAQVSTGDQTVLDIGCNLGDFTARFAQMGFFAVGIDSSPETILAAMKRNGGLNNVAFGTCYLSPQSVNLLPSFDIILCLSVAHYWHRAFGENQCWLMVEKLVSRTKTLVLEVASVNRKYGDEPPGFVDNDEATIRQYFLNRLQHAVSQETSVRYLGKSACIGKEPFRHMFVVRKHLRADE
jgi:SAM-dependent methyltransferase